MTPRTRPTSPRRQYIPLPPSPLALSHYDIFDDEFESDSDSESDGNDDRRSLIYSDFNILEPSEPIVKDHDYISAFDSLAFGDLLLPPVKTFTEDERTTEIRLEKERQKKVSFVQFGF